MSCLFHDCVHDVHLSCRTLGCCGGWYALAESKAPAGYRVHANNNPTIRALAAAGLITLQRDPDAKGIATARATERGLAR